MKNRISLFLALVSVLMSFTVKAQVKIGHINTDELVMAMPETDSINKILKDLSDHYQKLGEELKVKYNQELEVYNQNLATYKPMEKKLKEEELYDMQNRIQRFATESQQDYANQQQTLFAPVLKKAQDAITQVADESGFTYVIDSARGSLVYLPKDEALNLMAAVKAKLGLL